MKNLLAAVLALAIFIDSFFLWCFVRAADPEGEASSSCLREELPSMPNGRGKVITGHATFCDDFVHDSAYYFYLHDDGERDSSASLFFRFGDGDGNEPIIEWSGPSSVRVSVGKVSEVTKALDAISGVLISYDIGEKKFPDFDPLNEMLNFIVVASVTDGCLILLAVWLAHARTSIRLL